MDRFFNRPLFQWTALVKSPFNRHRKTSFNKPKRVSLERSIQVTDLGLLQDRLGYHFQNILYLHQALTHVSALSGLNRLDSYQRLEFLGDRVLGLVIADLLLAHFPKAEEGELSRRLAELVRRETCASVALDWGIDQTMRLGEGEYSSGGAHKSAILSDICESIIGAVYQDGGFGAAQKLVLEAFGERMNQEERSLRDAKTSLQEWAQGRGLPSPRYQEVARSGPAHAPQFRIAVLVQDHELVEADGGSKRIAEQRAAAAFIEKYHLSDKGAYHES